MQKFGVAGNGWLLFILMALPQPVDHWSGRA
jgi:hypothetical protein